MFLPILTPKDFSERVRLGRPDAAREDATLEFKQLCKYDEGVASNDAREVARDITQFANTGGGTVIYGVNERIDPASGLRIAEGLVPIRDLEKATTWLVRSIARYVYPATPRASVTPIAVDDDHVIAVNVEPAIHLQGVWDRGDEIRGMEFLYRNNNEKAWMTVDEVGLRFSSATRARAIRLQQLLARIPAGDGRKRVTIFHVMVRKEGDVIRNVYAPVAGTCEIVATESEQFSVRVHRDSSSSEQPLAVPYEHVAALWWDTAAYRPVIQLNAIVDMNRITPAIVP